MSAQKIKKE